MAEKINSICDDLRSGKATTRKEAFKQLDNSLESHTVLAALDRTTSAIRPGESVYANTWPGLGASILDYVRSEVDRGKGTKRGPEAGMIRIVKKFFQSAEASRKDRGPHVLQLRAAKILLLVHHIISSAALTTPLGEDFGNLLRPHLLSVVPYTKAASPVVFQGLITMYLNFIVSDEIKRVDKLINHVNTLQLLFQNFPADMTLESQMESLQAFKKIFKSLRGSQEARKAAVVFECLNWFLIRNGLDVFTHLPEFHTAVQPVLILLWPSRDARLRESMVMYLGLQLKLGGIQNLLGGLSHLDDVYAAVLKDLNKSSSTLQWNSDSLTKAQISYLRMLAELSYQHAKQWKSSQILNAVTSPGQRNKKRQKVTDAWEELFTNAVTSDVWALVLGDLALNPRRPFPSALLLGWIESLASMFATVDYEGASSRRNSLGSGASAELLAALLMAWAQGHHQHRLGAIHTASPQKHAIPQQLLLSVVKHAAACLKTLKGTKEDERAAKQFCKLLRILMLFGVDIEDIELAGITLAGLRELPGGVQPESLRLHTALTRAANGLAGQELACTVDWILEGKVTLELKAEGILAAMGLPGWKQHTLYQPSKIELLPKADELHVDQHCTRGEDRLPALSSISPATKAPECKHAVPSVSTLQAVASKLASHLTRLTEENVRGDAESSALACGVCAVTMQILGCLYETQTIAGSEINPGFAKYWGQQSPLRGKLTASLKRICLGLSETLQKEAELPESLLTALTVVCQAARALKTFNDEVCNSSEVKELGSRIVTVFKSSEGINVAENTQQMELFDEELDAAVPAYNGRALDAGNSTAHTVLTRQHMCLRLFAIWGIWFPSETLEHLGELFEFLEKGPTNPQPSLFNGITILSGDLTAGLNSPEIMFERLKTLYNQSYCHLFNNDNLLIALQQMKRQAEVLLDWSQEPDGEDRTCAPSQIQDIATRMGGMLNDVRQCIDAVNEKAQCERTRWQVRSEFAWVTISLVKLDFKGMMKQDWCRPVLVEILSDASYEARASAVGLLQEAQHETITAEEEHSTEKSLHKEMTEGMVVALGPNDDSDGLAERVETAILQLCQGSAPNLGVEFETLKTICLQAAWLPSSFPMASAAVELLARRQGYPSREAYINFHILKLVSAWFVLDCLSLKLLLSIKVLLCTSTNGPVTDKAFLEAHAACIMPALIMKQAKLQLDPSSTTLVDESREEIKTAAVLMGLSVKQMMNLHFPSIYAIVRLSTSISHLQPVGNEAMENVLGAHLSRAERNNLFTQTIVAVIALMLQLADPDPVCKLPYVNTGSILQNIVSLPGRSTKEDNERMLQDQILDADRYQFLLNKLHSWVKEARSPVHMHHRLESLKVFMQMAGQRVNDAPIFRYLTHILLSCLVFKENETEICLSLSKLISSVIDAKAFDVLGPMLQQILFGLASTLNTLSPDESAHHDSSPVIKLILKVTTQAQKDLHGYLKLVEPLPDHPALESARKLLTKLRQGVRLSQDVQNFTSRVSSMPAGLRSHSLSVLRAQLQHSKKALQEDFNSPDASIRAKMRATAWQLARESSELKDRDLCSFAGQIMAIMGPLSQECIAFTDGTLNQGALEVSGGDRFSLPPSAQAFEECCVQILKQLSAYLIDEDESTIALAQYTLRQLLREQKPPEGEDEQETNATAKQVKAMQNALQRLDPVTISYLSLYQHGRKTQRPDFQAELGSTEWELANNDGLWKCPPQHYQKWVCKLVHALLLRTKSAILRACHSMVLLKPKFAELLLPHVLLDLAVFKSEEDSEFVLVLSLNFSRHILKDTSADTRAVSLVLVGLNHLRSFLLDTQQGGSVQGDASSLDCLKAYHASNEIWMKVYWLAIDYLEVASASLRCTAYMTALAYVEEWGIDTHGWLDNLTDNLPAPQEGQPSAASLLVSIYSHIQDPDSIYSVVQSHPPSSLLPLLEHEGNWAECLSCYALDPTAPQATSGIVNALNKLNCHSLTFDYLATAQQNQGKPDVWAFDAQCEAAWKLGKWQDVPVSRHSSAGSATSFNSTVCSCLKLLEAKNEVQCKQLLQEARQALLLSIHSTTTQVASDINPALMKLQMLEILDEACSPHTDHHSTVLSQPDYTGNSRAYDLLEPLNQIRKAVLTVSKDQTCISTLLYSNVRQARKAQRLPQATSALQELQSLFSRSGNRNSRGEDVKELVFLSHIEEAKLLWAENRHDLAIREIQRLHKTSDLHPKNQILVHKIQTLLGKWQSARRSENAAKILESLEDTCVHFHEASLPNDAMWTTEACRSAFRLAQYVDNLYNNLVAYFKSPEWTTAKGVIAFKEEQLKRFTDQYNARAKAIGRSKLLNKDGHITDNQCALMRNQMLRLEQTIDTDKEDIKKQRRHEGRYRQVAMMAFVRCLEWGSTHDVVAMFRLVELWLHHHEDEDVNSVFDPEGLQSIASHKFLVLAYQMASRLGAAKSAGGATQAKTQNSAAFQGNLTSLLVRLGRDHPYHILYQLLSLKNGDRNRQGEQESPSKDKTVKQKVDLDKIQAAINVIDHISMQSSRAKLVDQVTTVVEAYIELAAIPVSRAATQLTISSAWRRRIRSLELVPVVSKEVPIDPSCSYSDIAYVVEFGSTMRFVGGINKPKLITCTDSKGIQHKQLVKSGSDDLRQDGVMQQFFGLVNHVLTESEATRRRQLQIRTYKVVPFSPFAGLLEWVEETMPLGEYLMGDGRDRKGGAHALHRPQDWTRTSCQKKIQQATLGSEKLDAYKEVEKHFKPVLHYFFLEFFRDPALWFEKRMSYTRSTAVNSIAGYIIGLGDRHSSNLLIDKANAEIIHIDLGVAFEQGKFLTTPERVPFRLTRDIVDGMGITGVEGTMRRCCEETLRVLRQNKEFLLTIIEVLIHDPLYKWGLTAEVAQKRQADSEESPEEAVELPEGLIANADAERAILKIRHKLDGLEQGADEAIGIEGQVQQLLQEAMSVENLSQMYVGWAAWY